MVELRVEVFYPFLSGEERRGRRRDRMGVEQFIDYRRYYELIDSRYM